MRRLYIVLALLALLLVSCEIRKPVFPEWDVTLNLPLMNEKYFVSELVDSVNIVLDDGDVITLRGTGTFETPVLGEITVDPGLNLQGVPIFSGVNDEVKLPFADVNNKVNLSYGIIESGTLGFRFENVPPEVSRIELSILELKRADGEPFIMEYEGHSDWMEPGLGGWRIGVKNSGVFVDSLTIQISAQSSLPMGTPLGTLSIRTTTPIGFSEFEGHLDDYAMHISDNVNEIDIDYPLGLEDAIQLQEARLYLDIRNPMGFELDFFGEIYAENTRNGTKETIPILDKDGKPYLIEAAKPDSIATTPISFTQNVSRLLQIMPDKIQLKNARFEIKCCSTGIGWAKSTDLIRGNYQVDAPFTFELFESDIRLKDAIELEISEDNRSIIRNNARFAELSLLVENKLPIGVRATMYISEDKEIDMDDSATWILEKPVVLSAQEGFQPIEVKLSEDEIQVFDKSKLYMFWRFGFEATNGVVSITASPADYIHIKSMIKLGVRVKEEDK